MNSLIHWLLRDNPSLIGDLLEERSAGRSRAWFIRQLIVAVARSMATSARHNPVLIARAIVFAACCYLLLASLTAVAEGYVYGYFFSPDTWSRAPGSFRLAIPIVLIPSVFTGWVVVRTHRACAQAAIAAVILFWAAVATPWDWIGAASVIGFLAGAIFDVSHDRRSPAVLK